ncbi:putative nuclease of restriction endonuclease-like (RecB) superfamily [Chitinophaga polysaccharea]|uniref:Putative nuclease of restriction endonuclease-like (RecB) superfamily n=1 Tax=Chitinophaga polysaccharea TaxID=1293035 RepID=A0A561P3T6_9BACT|nr:PDDEXK nuclease domain-containing protein [Chitinophaga polysaccharea]TWF32780.1 putative nuclease of restriction endonuclease-like (RecB) superfamily [Chitinophaga polysaccharea]
MARGKNATSIEQSLFNELSQLIEQSQRQVFSHANSTLTILFWQIGKRINDEILRNKRAEYAKQIVSTLSTQLKSQYGRNFEIRNLRRMMQFAEQFTKLEIILPLSQQLSWSHFVELLPLKNPDAKLFYAQLAVNQALGIRDLRKQISTKTFERTGIANIQNTSNHPAINDNFKNPYFLDFLGLQNTYMEKDLEEAILRELEAFILELGKGFAFIERQKRMIIDGEDFHLDLLFYHRNLKRLVAVELKLGKFEAQHKGQMELYLKWLDKYEKQEGEQSPIGLILCAESKRERVELLEMHKDGIVVAEYWTELPPKKELEKKIHHLFLEAKERIEHKKVLE